ncbi:hypothetical protein DFJ43DRAFT_1137413 [Lentinula guzmanii]|uniref:DUF6534 domain-containing protein n=1 Tax=Lentinula guzmanii TaxID=2804957 RepID=A0AA38JXD8_9AGAR|nr:hypothetical protein DFJ43DRAFT_1137413 [Lentinula guzmanii]
MQFAPTDLLDEVNLEPPTKMLRIHNASAFDLMLWQLHWPKDATYTQVEECFESCVSLIFTSLQNMAASMNTTFGMLFDAVVIGAALYGAGCVQGYMYYRKQQGDPWYLKSLVGFILICDTLQVGILTVYQYVILNFAHEEILAVMLDTLIIEIFFSDAIALAVQMFYCWRIWRLSQGSYLVVVPLVLLSWAAFVSLLVYSCLSLQFETFEELTTLKNLSMTCNILAAVSDVMISSAMVLFLQKAKSTHKRTNSMLNRLIIFTFNTGLPVSFCALWACISINAWPTTFVYMFFFLLQGRLYTNSLLVSLNSRNYIKKGNVLTETGTSYVMRPYNDSRGNAELSGLHSSRNSKVSNSQDGTGIAIRIETTRHTDIEFAEDLETSKIEV